MPRHRIKRTNIEFPTDLEPVRHFLFRCFVGVDEEHDKAWRRFWKTAFRMAFGNLIDWETLFPRNPLFHRKFFALLDIGFDAWQPELTHNGVVVAKNKEQFREDVTILAGYYVQTWTLTGEMRLRAMSISFASMDDHDFESLYSGVANVLLSNVLRNYAGRAELDSVVEKMIGFL